MNESKGNIRKRELTRNALNLATNDFGNENIESEKQMFNFDFVNKDEEQFETCNDAKKLKTKIPKLNFKKPQCNDKNFTNQATEIVQLQT